MPSKRARRSRSPGNGGKFRAPLGWKRRDFIWRGFRHVFNHAYDLTIDPERLALVMRDAETIVGALPGACDAFVAEVARREKWELGAGQGESERGR